MYTFEATETTHLTGNEEIRRPSLADDIYSWIRIDQWSSEQYKVSGLVLLLIFASSCERLMFKVAVDQVSPYRTVSMIMIYIISLVIFCLISFKRTDAHKVFAHRKFVIMALLDTISFGGMIVSATGVTPTMTVILMHANTPFIVWGSLYMFPNRKYSPVQIRGVLFISCAILLSMSRPVLLMWSKDFSERVLCALVYVLSAAMQAFGALYKEKTIIELSQPTDVYVLSAWLFFYQAMWSFVLAPLFYKLQTISGVWQDYPLENLFVNLQDGLRCFFGFINPYADRYYNTDDMSCAYYGVILLCYVVCTVAVLESVNRILQLNNRILGRSMVVAVFVAFVVLMIYDIVYSDGIEDSTIGLADFCSITVLLIGMEVFGRDPEPNVEVITNYTPVVELQPMSPG